MSNYTNDLKKDLSQIKRDRKIFPRYAIWFGKENSHKYIVWDNNIISRYKGQPIKNIVAMKPYLNTHFTPEAKQNVIDIFDAKGYYFDSLITMSYFQGDLQLIRK
jgi:hypothetical protein